MNNQKNVLSFHNDKFANLIFLPVMINNTCTTAFFDTGAGISCVSKSLADKANIICDGGSARGGNNTGEIIEFQKGTVNSVIINNHTIKDIVVGIIPDEHLDFGKDSEGNIFPALMIIGWDIISRFCWKFNMTVKRVEITEGGSSINNNSLIWNNYPIINILYNNITHKIGFDSGHTESLLDNSWINILTNIQQTTDAIQGVGSSKTEQVWICEKFSFGLGEKEISLNNVEILNHGIYGANDSMCGLFGADIIQDSEWIIDFQSNHFSIK